MDGFVWDDLVQEVVFHVDLHEAVDDGYSQKIQVLRRSVEPDSGCLAKSYLGRVVCGVDVLAG